MDPLLKRKKPPACDYCKAKRVLCHPSPDGCPRCLEKGIICTTTPVVRRRPQKKAVHGAPGDSSAPPAAASTSQAVPPAAPLASTSAAISFSSTPLAFSFPATPATDLSSLSVLGAVPSTSSLANAAQGAELPVITPELAQHLFHCFQQSSIYDHPLLKLVDFPSLLNLASSSSSSATSSSPHTPIQLDSFPPAQRTLLYCALTTGALLSFHPSIIGPPPSSSPSSPSPPAPDPVSFAQLNSAILAARQLQRSGTGSAPDLREYGRRRRGVCAAMRGEAERLAKVGDAAFEASVENAASCMMLDSLTGVELSSPTTTSSASPPPRPWLAAYVSHVSSLAEDETLRGPNGDLVFDPQMWNPFFVSEVMCDVGGARTATKETDHITLAGADVPDAAQLDKAMKEMLLQPTDRMLWPDHLSYGRLILAAIRELTDKFLSTHARRAPLNDPALTSLLTTLTHLRSIAASTTTLFTRLDTTTTAPHARPAPAPETQWLFPHALPKANAMRYDGAMARHGFKTLAALGWTALVLPLYRELQRRCAAASSSTPNGDADEDFEARQARDRLDLSLRQVRELLLLAMEVKVGAVEANPHPLRRLGVAEWAEALVEEVEAGRWRVEGKVVDIVERFSSTLKLLGYAHSSPRIDDLVLRLDNHALAYRLTASIPAIASSTAPSSSFAAPSLASTSAAHMVNPLLLANAPFQAPALTVPGAFSAPSFAAPPPAPDPLAAQLAALEADLDLPASGGGQGAAAPSVAAAAPMDVGAFSELVAMEDVSDALGLAEWQVW
ncbi:hypothetical protein JCM6882_002093 [Rhodosporidiobolus microsporus]